jgi:predicted nucleotidyltransferase
LYHKVASKEESIMDPSKMLQDKRDEILRIAAAHGAQNVPVFGSVSRGEAGAKSDDLIAIKRDLEDLLGREIDMVTEDAVSAYIREQVLKEAVNILKSHGGENEALSSENTLPWNESLENPGG